MTIQDKIKKILVEKLEVDETDVVPKAHLLDDLGLDSLDFTELIMLLEEEFEIDISDDQQMSLATMQDIVDFVGGKEPSSGESIVGIFDFSSAIISGAA